MVFIAWYGNIKAVLIVPQKEITLQHSVLYHLCWYHSNAYENISHNSEKIWF